MPVMPTASLSAGLCIFKVKLKNQGNTSTFTPPDSYNSNFTLVPTINNPERWPD